jgi:hypothetical protein
MRRIGRRRGGGGGEKRSLKTERENKMTILGFFQSFFCNDF